MTIRVRHLANDETQSSDNSTYELRLPVSGNLHALMVRIQATNGATSGRNVTPLDIADEVRIVGDGDEKYFLQTPREIEKMVEAMEGVPLEMVHDEAASAVQSVVLPIKFGRELRDKMYFLPLSRIKNPRLEIAYSPTIAADAGFATGTTVIDVVALWSPDSAGYQYQGTLVSRTIKSFTSAASGDETTDIDILDPLRFVAVYAYENQVADGTDITRVRLEANSGEYDLLDADWLDLLNLNRLLFGSMIKHNFKLLAQNDDVLDSRLSRIKQWSLDAFGGNDAAADTFLTYVVDAITGDRLTLDGNIGDITAGAETYVADTTDRNLYLTVEGVSPSYYGVIPFAIKEDVSNFLNPKSFDKLRLILTQGGAGASVRITLQYLKQVIGG